MNPETATLTAVPDTTATSASIGADDRKLVISDLHVVPTSNPEREILRGIDLVVRKGEVHAIMGRNGSGKTTLAYALMGHPAYTVTGGEVRWKGIDILALSPDKRARMGLFLAFQYPTAIPGLSVASFLRTALNARRRRLEGGDGEHDPSDPTRGGIRMGEFRTLLREKLALLKLDDSFAARYVNEGFSGGEKKRLEMLQMAMLEPAMAILDETDSGLDIDALRIVADGVNAMRNPDLGILLITHYQRLLNYIQPDFVHVLAQGRIVKSGGAELALRLEEEGYGPLMREAGLSTDAPDEALFVPRGPEADEEDPPPDPDRMIRRAYSIASSSLEHDYLEFYVNLVSSGELTPRMFALAHGARIFLGPKATGMFTLDRVPEGKAIALVATGTGLAPYVSMLRTILVGDGNRRIAVLHGARYSWDLGYRGELESLARIRPNLTYLPSITRPARDPHFTGATGRLQALIADGILEKASGVALDPKRTDVFLCGNP